MNFKPVYAINDDAVAFFEFFSCIEVMIDYNCHGVMDSRSGKMVIPAIYSDISMISKDLLMAEVDGDEENNVVFTTSGVVVKSL